MPRTYVNERKYQSYTDEDENDDESRSIAPIKPIYFSCFLLLCKQKKLTKKTYLIIYCSFKSYQYLRSACIIYIYVKIRTLLKSECFPLSKKRADHNPRVF